MMQILSVKESFTGEVLYIPQEVQTCLLDSGAIFDMTPNIECFSDYSSDTNITIRLGNG